MATDERRIFRGHVNERKAHSLRDEPFAAGAELIGFAKANEGMRILGEDAQPDATKNFTGRVAILHRGFLNEHNAGIEADPDLWLTVKEIKRRYDAPGSMAFLRKRFIPVSEMSDEELERLNKAFGALASEDADAVLSPVVHLIEALPPAMRKESPASGRRPVVPKNIDWDLLQESRSEIGQFGEKYVCELERDWLQGAGRPDLAERVEHTAHVRGDGVGYDIHSFTPQGVDRYIEVKTTTGSLSTPFYITANELAVSERLSASFLLCRVYEFSAFLGVGRVKWYRGSLTP